MEEIHTIKPLELKEMIRLELKALIENPTSVNLKFLVTALMMICEMIAELQERIN